VYDDVAACDDDDGAATLQTPSGAKALTAGVCWHLVSEAA
jgi:hypothetical protein